jgi:folate-binding protein YgfZ
MDLATLVVRGPDRLEWLQGVLTCDVAELEPGQGRWGLVLTKPGKILADVWAVAGPEQVYLGVPRDAVARLQDWLGQFLIMEDAEVADASADHAWISLHGPRAEQVAALASARGGIWAPIDVTGLGGAALVVPEGAVRDVERAAIEAGAVPGGDADWLRLRVERAVPLYGTDMDDHRSPHEASLDRRCVSWTKGCYLGQEAVCMQDMRGKVKRKLELLELGTEELPPSGTAVLDDGGVAVGETRSAARSAVHGTALALAYLTTAAVEAKRPFTVAGAPARVAPSRK